MKVLKVCFVGLGSIGNRHLKNLVKIAGGIYNLEIHALRSRIVNNFEQDAYPKLKNFYNVKDLDKFYDIVIITNPTALHYKTLKTFSNLSDFFFIEKPIFSKMYKNEFILSLKNKKIYVAAPLRFKDVYQKSKNIIYGLVDDRVISSRIICSSYLPDWQPGRDYKSSFRASQKLGGGLATDLIHEIDYMIDLFGLPNKIKKIERKLSNLTLKVNDISTFLFEYPNQIIEMHLDYFGRKPIRKIEMWTNNNYFEVDFLNSTISHNEDLIRCIKNDMYYDEMKYILDLFENKVDNINNLDNALNTLRVAI